MRAAIFSKSESFGVVASYFGSRGAFKWRDKSHTPSNKRSGEVKSHAEVVVTDEPDGVNTLDGVRIAAKGWIQIDLTEMVEHAASGRTRWKTISILMGSEARAALLEYLRREGTGE